MKPTGIFFGSTTGQTRDAAFKIAEKLGIQPADIHDVASTPPSAVAPYDNIILGSSTWGSGDLEEDWYDFILGLESMDLKGKKVALFGCGDTSMTDTFCDAVGIIRERLNKTGATFIGEGYTTFGLDFKASKAVDAEGNAVGLLLDNVNHEDFTDGRIAAWTKLIAPEL